MFIYSSFDILYMCWYIMKLYKRVHELNQDKVLYKTYLIYYLGGLHNSKCQVPCDSRKKVSAYFTLVSLCFSDPLRPALVRVENWEPLKPVVWCVRDVALIHYHSCTDSVKPSLQFLWLMIQGDHYSSRFLDATNKTL
jgi:hypothetical protein